MFQDDALFPIATSPPTSRFGLRMQGARPRASRGAGRGAARARRPRGARAPGVASLSGGERKRVALARALAPAPRVLLLDEPLGALDRPLHDRLVAELRDLFDEIGQTAVYVTHDVAEAFALGNRVAVLRAGASSRSRTRAALGRAGRRLGGAFIGLENVEERGATSLVTRPEGVVAPPRLPTAMRSSSLRAATGRSSRSAPATTTAARSSPPTQGSPPRTGDARRRARSISRAVIEVPTIWLPTDLDRLGPRRRQSSSSPASSSSQASSSSSSSSPSSSSSSSSGSSASSQASLTAVPFRRRSPPARPRRNATEWSRRMFVRQRLNARGAAGVAGHDLVEHRGDRCRRCAVGRCQARVPPTGSPG